MGAKKGKKPPQKPQEKNKKALQIDMAVASDLSSLATASFIEGLQHSNGPPLHSTAVEEDLAAAEEEQVQKKLTKRPAAHKETKNQKRPKSTPQKKATKRKSSGHADAARAVKKQMVKSQKGITSSEKSSQQSQEQSEGEAPSHGHRDMFSSDEDLEESWKPSPKKHKGLSSKRSRMSSSDRSRKSSSGSGYQPEKVREKKKLKRSSVTESEMVLDEFLDFFEQYKQTVESKAVNQALDYFASNVKDQLTEKIYSNKQLKTVMRENSKLASAIRTKRQRLLDAKNELIKSERQLWLLQKDKSELEQNLKDLNQSRTFLQNLRELNKRYLQHRQKNLQERETYGASSLPALLIEAKHVRTTELQLKEINDRLQKVVTEK
ncbi:hypothetical protein NQD34_007667 [Periophthalmus magnuspinnatus]|uniref:centromere protein U n=1 Tax=Periophthalmus magnuspinnatus TaxID=409849 RepID=UPI0022BD14CE|nr:centromere protein U [Periophthalmus magnuspinnatus]KAJ0002518.1 hypothetical protein NQD34_007667 [Periophthalmus magnuspinnatus]